MFSEEELFGTKHKDEKIDPLTLAEHKEGDAVTYCPLDPELRKSPWFNQAFRVKRVYFDTENGHFVYHIQSLEKHITLTDVDGKDLVRDILSSRAS